MQRNRVAVRAGERDQRRQNVHAARLRTRILSLESLNVYTVGRLLARGFSSVTTAGLVDSGLVSATIERMLAGQPSW
jgi:hypothetical protein